MWRSRRNRDGSKGYETCETCALCSAGRFHVYYGWPSPFWSSDYWKESWTNKKIQWGYIGKYTSEKRKELSKYRLKKKKKEKKYWSQRFEEDWIKSREKSLRTNFYWPFLPNKEQSINFYSNQGLYSQYQKENDQECTSRNPALKSLGRWNEEGMGGNW